MASIGHLTIAPLRSIQQWRDAASNAKSVHRALYYVWCVLGTAFWFVACFGYVCCLLVFPASLLGMGLSVAQKQPGLGWFIWAALVVIFWTTMFLIQISAAVRQFRARVLDIETLTTVFLMALSYALAAWYVSYEIGRVR